MYIIICKDNNTSVHRIWLEVKRTQRTTRGTLKPACHTIQKDPKWLLAKQRPLTCWTLGGARTGHTTKGRLTARRT